MATPAGPAGIRVLEAYEAIRRRPGMYVGDLENGDGMHHVLFAVIGRAIDDHLRGLGHEIRIALDGLRVTVEDDGPGPPAELLEQRVMAMHGAGRGREPPHPHLWFDASGFALPVACALASELEIEVWRDGWTYMRRFVRGEACGPVERRGRTPRTGTCIRFEPDFTILPRLPWDATRIARRCRELAALVPGLAIVLDDASYRDLDLLAFLCADRGDLIDRLHVRATVADVTVELALAHHRGPAELHTFANTIPCAGTHVLALRAAIERVVARRLGPPDGGPPSYPGLLAALHVTLRDPRFTSQARDQLANPKVGKAVYRVVEPALAAHLDRVPALLDALLLASESANAVPGIKGL